MNRRDFFKRAAVLLAAPFIAKAAPPIPDLPVEGEWMGFKWVQTEVITDADVVAFDRAVTKTYARFHHPNDFEAIR